jgi:hypothetical protein
MVSNSRYRRKGIRAAVILNIAAARVGYHTRNQPRKKARLEREILAKATLGSTSQRNILVEAFCG